MNFDNTSIQDLDIFVSCLYYFMSTIHMTLKFGILIVSSRPGGVTVIAPESKGGRKDEFEIGKPS